MADKSPKRIHSRAAEMVPASDDLGIDFPQERESAAGELWRRALAVNSESMARGAAVAGSFVAASFIKQKKEANRSRIQRMFGASPRLRAEEELKVMVGSQIAGGAASLAATAAIAGAQWYRDRKACLANARIIRRVIGVAAMAPDGSMTEESRLIFQGAMEGTGLTRADLWRLEAEPLPVSISDLESCALQEPLLSAVVTVAFSAMAAASSATEAVQRIPALLVRLGLPRPTAEAAARRCLEDYIAARVVLSDHYPLLRPAAAGTAPQFRLPLSQTVAAAQLAIACNPSEQARHASRKTVASVIRHGTRATLDSGIPLAPALSIVVRLADRLLGQQPPASVQQAASEHNDAGSLPPPRPRGTPQGELE
jgi:hypothetical protein